MASTIFSTAWLKGAGERAIKSGIQGGIAGLGLSTATAVGPGQLPGILSLPWGAALSGFVTLAILSLATSVAQPDFTAGTSEAGEPPAELDDDGLDATASDGELDDEGEDLEYDPEVDEEAIEVPMDYDDGLGPDESDEDDLYAPEHAAAGPSTPVRTDE